MFIEPVCGNFDIPHLQEINRRIFQDLPALGFSDVTPGRFRSPTPEKLDWVKSRKLESVNLITFVAYSSMDQKAQNRLDHALKQIDINALTKLNAITFSRTIAELYAAIDFIHPFKDGNSRTLREFTRELADTCGYKIEWERFDKTKAGRDILYIARDLNVNKLALPHIKDINTKRDILYTIDALEGNRDLIDVLQDVIQKGLQPKILNFQRGRSKDEGLGF
ncbi:MAG: Fic family protein [Helicobacteraceae bacterium]|nr:Fic family protein [Helicobacteraceae bacterium]